jgi:hypothetical protein
VGPGGGFDDLSLTQDLARSTITEGAVRSLFVVVNFVVNSPSFDPAPCVSQRGEDIGVEALVTQACIKRLDEAIVYRLARPNEI